MKTFLYAYLGGLLASAPAYAMFNDVGASPLRNFDALFNRISGSLWSIVLYFALIWIVPAIGSTIGAKIGGRQADFNYIYGRGVGGQFLFSIGFSILLLTVPNFAGPVYGMQAAMQTLVFLMFAQIGCSLGTVWGF